jgi:hypothetical protein
LKHQGKSELDQGAQELKKAESKTVQGIIDESAENIAKSMYRTYRILGGTIEALTNNDAGELKKVRKRVLKFEEEVESLRNNLFYLIKSLDETSVSGSNFYIFILANLTDIVQSLDYISKKSFKHVDNYHKALSKSQVLDLAEVQKQISTLLVEVESAFNTKRFNSLKVSLDRKAALLDLLSSKIDAQIDHTRREEISPKNTTLYFNVLLELKDMVRSVMNIVDEYHKSSAQR